MKNKYGALVKNMGLFTIGSLGSKILSFLMVPLYTYVLNSEDYGIVDLLASTASLLTPILLLSIQDAILRFSLDEEYEPEDVITTSLKIIFRGCLILLLGIIFVYFFNIFDLNLSYLLFLFFYFVFGALNNCFILYLKARDKVAVIVISGIINTFLACSLNVLLLLVFKWGINGYIVSNTLSVCVAVIYQVIGGKIYRDVHMHNYNDLSKPMLKYSCPLIANSLAWWVNNASDRYILTFIRGVSENGIYSVSYKIPTILSIFQNIFYNAWSISAITEFDSDDKDGFIGNNYIMYSFVSIITCSALLLMNIPLAHFLYSREYFVAWKSVPFLLAGTTFNGISMFQGCIFAATKRTKTVSVTTLLGALVNTICNFIFIYSWGSVGAAFATMVGYFITWLMRTIFLFGIVKMKVKWGKHFIACGLIILQAVMATIQVGIALQIILFIIIVILHFDCISQVLGLIKKRVRGASGSSKA